MRFFLGYGLIFFFQHVFTIVGVGIVVFVISWKLALISLAIAPVLDRGRVPLQPRLASAAPRRAAEDGRRRDRRRGEHRRRPRRQVVRAGAAPSRRSSSSAPSASSSRACKANRQRAFYVPLLCFLPLLAQAAILLVGGRMVARGSLSLGDFVAFNLFLALLVDAAAAARHVDRPGTARDRVRRAHLPGDRRARGDPRRPTARPTLPPGPGASPSSGVTFGYDPARPVLHDVDLELEPGRIVALIGHTGAGKTTLAALVPRFYDVQAGRVLGRRRRRARRDARPRCAARSA